MGHINKEEGYDTSTLKFFPWRHGSIMAAHTGPVLRETGLRCFLSFLIIYWVAWINWSWLYVHSTFFSPLRTAIYSEIAGWNFGNWVLHNMLVSWLRRWRESWKSVSLCPIQDHWVQIGLHHHVCKMLYGPFQVVCSGGAWGKLNSIELAHQWLDRVLLTSSFPVLFRYMCQAC